MAVTRARRHWRILLLSGTAVLTVAAGSLYTAGSTYAIETNPDWKSPLRDQGLTDYQLRARQLQWLVAGRSQLWLLSEDYAGRWDAWRWLQAHGFHLEVNERYAGDTHLQLFDRRPPAAFGPTVIRAAGFPSGWHQSGSAVLRGSDVRETGEASLSRAFSVRPGTAYTATLEYRSSASSPVPPAITIYRRCRAGQGIGKPLANFPRIEQFTLVTTSS